MKTTEDETQLLAEVLAAFSGMHARPMRDFSPRYAQSVGLWLASEGDMPDGLPIFTTFHYDEDSHDGFVHKAFIKWLEDRGWYAEAYDGATFLVFPIEDSAAAMPPLHAGSAQRGPWARGVHAG